MGKSVGSFGLSALLFLMGLALVAWGWWAQRQAQVSRSWPTVLGQVETTWVTEDADPDDGTAYQAHVRYRYAVAEQGYRSTRIQFMGPPSFSSRHKAEAFLARYPEGASVTVHYNPEDPSEAVLETTASKSLWVFVVGGVLMLGGLWNAWNTHALRQLG